MSTVVDIKDNSFLSYIKKFKGMPNRLHVLGKVPEDLEKRSVGVVGSRRVSSYGVRVLKELFYFLKDTGLVVVSGFTVGADSYAHEFALDSGCFTVAVMPCGCDIVTPAKNAGLYSRILNNGGAVISEYEDGFMPQKWTYPKRNRIIAALSRVLLVVEASLNSGSMITARYSFKYGRRVFSVPGDIYIERSLGTNKLLAEGASPYISPHGLLEEFGLNEMRKSENVSEEDGASLYVLLAGKLKEGPRSFDYLSSVMTLSPSKLSLMLSDLLMREKIGERGGLYYLL